MRFSSEFCKEMFEGRRLLVATKHEKEKTIAPVLEKELGVNCFVTSDFDTDQLGTFTGEVERKHDPVSTARLKCALAMELTNCDMAVASEGSFGAHPSIYFVPADEEILLFVDKKNGLEIMVRELSTKTNFNAAEIKSEPELIDFAITAGFPTHGLILKKHKADYKQMVKGITDWENLLATYHQLSKSDGLAYVETDMRAMYNPTRMGIIKKAAQKLAKKIKCLCPQCSAPGFGITNGTKGLPCELCSLPTQSTMSYTYNCQKCNYSMDEFYPNGKRKEDPMYCNVCNP